MMGFIQAIGGALLFLLFFGTILAAVGGLASGYKRYAIPGGLYLFFLLVMLIWGQQHGYVAKRVYVYENSAQN